MKRLFTLICLLNIFHFSFSMELIKNYFAKPKPLSNLDKQLLDSVVEQNKQKVENLIDKGANAVQMTVVLPRFS